MDLLIWLALFIVFAVLCWADYRDEHRGDR